MLTGRTIIVAAALPAIIGFSPAPSAAQSNISAAARAFSLGQQAELAGDYRGASEHYELADRTVPSPEALRSAAKTRLKAGDEAMAATHAEALARRYSDEKSREVADELLEELRPKLARVSLTCTPACGAIVDGGAIGVDEADVHVFYIEPGRHTIGAVYGTGDTQQERVEAAAGKTVSLTMVAPTQPAADVTVAAPPTVRRDAPPSRGLPRAWFIGSAVVTAALAGVSIWSGLDVLDRKTDYERDPTQERLDEGQRLQTRTNILWGVTGVAAIATGFIAWKTRWSKAEQPPRSVGIAPTAGGAILVFEGGFR